MSFFTRSNQPPTPASPVPLQIHPRELAALEGFRPDDQDVVRIVVNVGGTKMYAHTTRGYISSYKDAQIVAATHFPDYLPYDAREITFKGLARDRDGEWIVTTIPPDQWGFLAATFYEFEAGPCWIGGHLWVSTGHMVAGRMKWSAVRKVVHQEPVGKHLVGDPDTPWIDRPTSYANALELVQSAIANDIDLSKGLIPKSKEPWNLVKIPPSGVKFVKFLNDELTTWIPFPTKAYQDAGVWKGFVPEPGQIIGVVAIAV